MDGAEEGLPGGWVAQDPVEGGVGEGFCEGGLLEGWVGGDFGSVESY